MAAYLRPGGSAWNKEGTVLERYHTPFWSESQSSINTCFFLFFFFGFVFLFKGGGYIFFLNMKTNDIYNVVTTQYLLGQEISFWHYNNDDDDDINNKTKSVVLIFSTLLFFFLKHFLF